MKKLISFVISMALALNSGAAAAAGGLSNFAAVNEYTPGIFTDVKEEDWYSQSVAAAYELGLMKGESDTYFNAGRGLTVVEAVVLAARLHKIYNTGVDDFKQGSEVWYDPYVRYALENGIISSRFNIKATATRAQFADILSRALPEEALPEINQIGDNAIPDVKLGDDYAESIYLLYRAGIVTGSNARGSFYPNTGISRAEAAAIITRMTDKSLRKSVTLQYTGPELSEQASMDDDFFANSAILGNSLVDGLRLYSNLKTLNYFCATSVSVVSAMNTSSTTLANGSKGTLVQALCQKQYDRIYIELGINEIGYDVNYFIQLYGEMVDTIAQAEPNADIYILSVLPVTEKKSSSSSVFNMDRVNMYNEALRALAEEKQCWYMDVCTPLQGSDGYLPSDWSGDGVHLHAQYYAVWEECMRTHYA